MVVLDASKTLIPLAVIARDQVRRARGGTPRSCCRGPARPSRRTRGCPGPTPRSAAVPMELPSTALPPSVGLFTLVDGDAAGEIPRDHVPVRDGTSPRSCCRSPACRRRWPRSRARRCRSGRCRCSSPPPRRGSREKSIPSSANRLIASPRTLPSAWNSEPVGARAGPTPRQLDQRPAGVTRLGASVDVQAARDRREGRERGRSSSKCRRSANEMESDHPGRRSRRGWPPGASRGPGVEDVGGREIREELPALEREIVPGFTARPRAAPPPTSGRRSVRPPIQASG